MTQNNAVSGLSSGATQIGSKRILGLMTGAMFNLRKIELITDAMFHFETQFNVTLDPALCLSGQGPFSLRYWESGDDDGCTMTETASGKSYTYVEDHRVWRPFRY